MAVAIKKLGYTNIKIYNGGLKDWIKSGHITESIEPLPEIQIHFIDVEELMTALAEADERNCIDNDGNPLITLLDFRVTEGLSQKMGADKHKIKTNCQTISAPLDDFSNNTQLIQSIPEKGLIVSVCETGNRDVFLIRYLSKFDIFNIRSLKYGMRSWLKANYPVERIEQTGTD